MTKPSTNWSGRSACDRILVKAQYNLAMAYLPKYGVDKEIEQLQKVITLDPKFAEAYYSLGKALMQKGQIQEAIAPLRRAVSLDPMSGRAHYQLGLALSRTDKTEEGKLELDKGLKLTADDERNRKANALEAQAKLEMDKGETQQAAENLGKVVQLLPDYAEGHLTLAQALAKLGDLEGSIPEFKRALELQPNLYAAHFGLGQVLRRKGKPRGRRVGISRGHPSATLIGRSLQRVGLGVERRRRPEWRSGRLSKGLADRSRRMP